MCSVFKYTEYIICTILIFIVGGYVGKGLYLDSVDSAFLGIAHGTFWIPDGDFWLFGFITVVLVCGFAIVFGLFLESFFLVAKRIFLKVLIFVLSCCCPCWFCPWNDVDIDPIESITLKPNERRQRAKNDIEMEMGMLE